MKPQPKLLLSTMSNPQPSYWFITRASEKRGEMQKSIVTSFPFAQEKYHKRIHHIWPGHQKCVVLCRHFVEAPPVGNPVHHVQFADVSLEVPVAYNTVEWTVTQHICSRFCFALFWVGFSNCSGRPREWFTYIPLIWFTRIVPIITLARASPECMNS